MEKLEAFRAATGALKDVSFDSISGAGPHGAIVHYRVTRKTNRRIEPRQLFLIDSGAQFVDGTTDVTHGGGGEPTRDATVSRACSRGIQLALARFPKALPGAARRVRAAAVDAGLDKATARAMASALSSVHEGPQISRGVGQALARHDCSTSRAITRPANTASASKLVVARAPRSPAARSDVVSRPSPWRRSPCW